MRVIETWKTNLVPFWNKRNITQNCRKDLAPHKMGFMYVQVMFTLIVDPQPKPNPSSAIPQFRQGG